MNEHAAAPCFAGFRYCADEDTIVSSAGEAVGVSAQAQRLFGLLARNHDQILAGQEIVSKVWSATTTDENALNNSISELRELLGDTEHRILRSVPGQAFMLVSDAQSGLFDNQTLDLSSPSLELEQRNWREKWRPLISGVMLLAGTLLAGILYFNQGKPDSHNKPDTGCEQTAETDC